MSNVFFTSDTHFGHRNIIHYCDRPYRDTSHMDEDLIAKWNTKVRPTDSVYHCGDFAWYREEDKLVQVLERLNGILHLVPGNHDSEKQLKVLAQYAIILPPIHRVKWMKENIILCHYPLRSWHHNMRGAWHLYGHCHNTVPGIGKSFDCGVDAWGFAPLSFDEVRREMDQRPLVVAEPGFRCNLCRKFPCECPDSDQPKDPADL